MNLKFLDEKDLLNIAEHTAARYSKYTLITTYIELRSEAYLHMLTANPTRPKNTRAEEYGYMVRRARDGIRMFLRFLDHGKRRCIPRSLCSFRPTFTIEKIVGGQPYPFSDPLLVDRIKALPKLQQETVVQFYYLGMSLSEIAKHRGVSEGGVSNSKGRALKKLRDVGIPLE